MLEWFNKTRNNWNQEAQRQAAAIISIEKLHQYKNVMLENKKVRQELYKLIWASGAGFFGGLIFAKICFKQIKYRLVAASAPPTVILFWAWPYFAANIVEELATEPTDYGQIIRAVFIFKYPEGPHTEQYEKLSEDYRKYKFIKQAQQEKKIQESET